MNPWWDQLANLIARVLAERWLMRNETDAGNQIDRRPGAEEAGDRVEGAENDPKERPDSIDGLPIDGD
jgi:hypothetical protein